MKKFFTSKLFRAMWSIGLAALLYWICPPCISKTTIAIVLGTLVVLVNASSIISKAPIVTHVTRIFVGGLFIFSGFIKANDPLGFSYKLKEYFEVFTADSGLSIFESMAHIALPLSIILCVSEMALGFMLLVGYKRNLTLGLLLAQITFFTFLTFYSACYNKVTTCGCFGDFLVLKPWESFWKDIVLMVAITLLFAGKENINERFNPLITTAVTIIAIVLSIAFPIYTYRNLPIFDFRAYKIGDNIKENMKPGIGYQPAVYESLLEYKNLKTGEIKAFNQKDYMDSKIWEDTLTWAWHNTVNKLVHDAINPPKIIDFSINNQNGEPITDSILNNPNYQFLLVCYDITETADDATLHAKINDLNKLASIDKINVLGLTASDAKQVDDYKHKHQALYDFATSDGVVLKTIIRSNPGLVLIKNGTVIMNWHYNNFPSYSDVKQKYMK
ncbi:MAG: DoxX family protein [Bacteroidia bacterium]|nr:DoxX family protein [Bacteroidia bacterium]